MTDDGFKTLSKTLEQISDGLAKSKDKETEIIVEHSNFVDKRPIKENVVSATDEAARHEARYRAARLQQPFDESNTNTEELAKASDEIVDRFLRDYLKDLFGDM